MQALRDTSPPGTQLEKETKRNGWLLQAGAWIVILANFAWFNWKVPQSPFAPDEMMNMGWAWEAGLPKILGSAAAFFTSFYRPVGQLYYWILYNLFGLHYVPFRIVDLCILLLNLWLAFCLFRRLSGSLVVAYLSAFFFSYQEKVMVWLDYNGAYVYDRLCFTFFAAALLLYIRRRSNGERLNPRSAAVVAMLYALSLGSKEMAVSLPPLLLAYELLYHPTRSLMKNWRPILLLTLMTVAYIYGKRQPGEERGIYPYLLKDVEVTPVNQAWSHGPGALTEIDTYRLHGVSVNHFLASQSGYIDQFLIGQFYLKPIHVACLILAAALLAAMFRSRSLGLALVYMLVTPLPIVFLNRGGGCLYIPLLGWCLFAAQLTICLAGFIGNVIPYGGGYFRAGVQAAFAMSLAVPLIQRNLRAQSFEMEPMLRNGALTWQIIQDFNRVRPPIRPNDKVYISNSPFSGYDVSFITMLWANVRPLQIYEPGKSLPAGAPPPPDINVIVSFDAGNHMFLDSVRH